MDRHRELLRYWERTFNDAVAIGDRQRAEQAAQSWLLTLRVIKQLRIRQCEGKAWLRARHDAQMEQRRVAATCPGSGGNSPLRAP
jgi:hypothetical protein